MNKKFLISTIICLVLCSSIFFMGYKRVKSPKELFRVYLDGVSIGYIESKEELEAYIDDKEDEIKNKYGVDKVFLPNNLSIEKEKTFNGHIMSPEDIYNQIKDRAPFTINGYEIRIKGVKEIKEDEDVSTTKTVVVYVLDKNVFIDSVDETIKAFIKEEEYEAFKNDLQKQINNTGKIIENVYIKNAITIREANISVENKIFTNKDELSKFLLFGDSTSEKKYIVKAGDTVEDVAYNNKMSSNELLVANPSLTSEDNLLYVGQELNVATIDPAFKVVEKDYVVEIQTLEYNTIYKDDKTLAKGKEKVSVKGVNGSAKVSYNIIKENGDTIDVESDSSVMLKKPVDKIILRGTKVESSSGGSSGGNSGGSYSTNGVKANGVWFWPTIKPYKITSPYGYRGRGFHAGTDIQPTNGKTLNSNIYASNNGVVAQSGYTGYNGNFIVIDHGNGWFTSYGHLNKRLVKVGDRVSQGQIIGKMGKTGRATGVHLHFGLWKGAKPYYPGSTSYNPMKTLKFQ